MNRHRIDSPDGAVCAIARFSEGRDPATGTPGVALNVRCLPVLDLAGLKVVSLDGAHL